MIGQGWRMLVECLSVGRAISLPSTAAGGVQAWACRRDRCVCADPQAVSDADRSIRGCRRSAGARSAAIPMPIDGTGAHDRSTRLIWARSPLCHRPSPSTTPPKWAAAVVKDVDGYPRRQGHHPRPAQLRRACLSRRRQSRITVEGANILTRSMIIFGQGAVRCHPFVLKEMQRRSAGGSAGSVSRHSMPLLMASCWLRASAMQFDRCLPARPQCTHNPGHGTSAGDASTAKFYRKADALQRPPWPSSPTPPC